MSMDSHAGDGGQVLPRSRDDDPTVCERCAAPVALVTALPRRIDHAAYRIFACTVRNFVQWIPD
jgi:hypothetical protein